MWIYFQRLREKIPTACYQPPSGCNGKKNSSNKFFLCECGRIKNQAHIIPCPESTYNWEDFMKSYKQ